jgi:hypothetical protein
MWFYKGRIQTVATVVYVTSDFPRDILFQGVPFLKLLKTKTLYYFLIADIFNFSLKLSAIFFQIC